MSRKPSKHGLERKYKPWRKGMGKKDVERKLSGSLKNQLRSQRRLLSKLEKGSEARDQIEQKIKELESSIFEKERVEKEKKNAHKYHHIKFFERQKLTRMERKISKNLEEAKTAADFDDVKKYERQLERIILDQLYVAFYPNDTKYMSLFTSHDQKTQTKQMVIRQQIIQRIQKGGHHFIQENTKKKSWVNLSFLVEKGILDSENYDLQSSVENGKELYKEKYQEKKQQINREKELQKEFQKDIQKRNVDILSSQEQNHQTQIGGEKSSAGSSDSDESSDHLNSSSDDDSIDKQKEGLNRHDSTKIDPKLDTAVVKELNNMNESSSGLNKSSSDSSSDSTSDSDSENSEDDKESVSISENKSDSKRNLSDNDNDDSEDDFLVAKNQDTSPENVFAKAPRVDNKDFFLQKGDKTKGWATQKQRPGEWKKKRQRR